MPRLGRAVVPSYPHPVIQRGHNKQVVFAEPGDFQYYLATLAEFKEEYVEAIVGRRIEHRKQERPSKGSKK